MGALALILEKTGKLKSKDKSEPGTEADLDLDSDDEKSPAEDYAREAFKALKDDDEEAFVEAFLGVCRCVHEENED